MSGLSLVKIVNLEGVQALTSTSQQRGGGTTPELLMPSRPASPVRTRQASFLHPLILACSHLAIVHMHASTSAPAHVWHHGF